VYLLLFAVLASPVFGAWLDACRSNEGSKGNLNRIMLRLNSAIKRNNLKKIDTLTHRLFKNPTDLRSQICLIRSHVYMAEINLGGEIAYAKKCGLEKSEKLLNLIQDDLDYFLATAREPDADEVSEENNKEISNQLARMVQLLPPMYRKLEGTVHQLIVMRRNMESRHKQEFCVYHRLLQDAARNCYRKAVNLYKYASRSQRNFVVTTNQRADLGSFIREAEDWRNRMSMNKHSAIRKVRAKIAETKAQMPLLGKENYLQAFANIRDNCEDLQDLIKDLDQIKECPIYMHLHWVTG